MRIYTSCSCFVVLHYRPESRGLGPKHLDLFLLDLLEDLQPLHGNADDHALEGYHNLITSPSAGRPAIPKALRPLFNRAGPYSFVHARKIPRG